MPDGSYNYTERVHEVMRLADEERERLGHLYLGTEHVLLGLIREGEGIGAVVLTFLGSRMDIDEARRIVERLVTPEDES